MKFTTVTIKFKQIIMKVYINEYVLYPNLLKYPKYPKYHPH